jgi:hypothetical protein
MKSLITPVKLVYLYPSNQKKDLARRSWGRGTCNYERVPCRTTNTNEQASTGTLSLVLSANTCIPRILNREKRPRTPILSRGFFFDYKRKFPHTLLWVEAHGPPLPHCPTTGTKQSSLLYYPALITEVAVGARPHWSFGSTLIPGELHGCMLTPQEVRRHIKRSVPRARI